MILMRNIPFLHIGNNYIAWQNVTYIERTSSGHKIELIGGDWVMIEAPADVEVLDRLLNLPSMSLDLHHFAQAEQAVKASAKSVDAAAPQSPPAHCLGGSDAPMDGCTDPPNSLLTLAGG